MSASVRLVPCRSDVTDYNERCLKVNEDSKDQCVVLTKTVLRNCCHLVNYSSLLQIILHHSCQFGRAILRTFLRAN